MGQDMHGAAPAAAELRPGDPMTSIRGLQRRVGDGVRS